jgi:hypothetical protein
MSIVFSLVCNLVSAQVMDVSLDSKQCCAAIFIVLAKAFDTVDHSIPVGRLRSIGVSEGFWPGLLATALRVQCMK